MCEKKLKYILEKKEFYKKGDIVLLEYWYNDMIVKVMIKEIMCRKIIVTHNIPESEIFNAPDEEIRVYDIIDIARS
jgi:hypothetical protein